MEEWSVEKPDNYPLAITPSPQYSSTPEFGSFVLLPKHREALRVKQNPMIKLLVIR